MSEIRESKQSAHSGTSVGAVLVSLLVLAAGLYMLFDGSLSYILARTLGVATQGVIEKMTESEVEYFDVGEAKYLVDYSFVLPDGKVVQGHTQLARTDWFSLRVGEKVTVQYFAHYPRFNYLAEYRLWGARIVVMILFPIVFCGLGFFFLWQAFRAKKPQSLSDQNNMSKGSK